jgi:glycosyltransferase involved in cell wall biosynthesis
VFSHLGKNGFSQAMLIFLLYLPLLFCQKMFDHENLIINTYGDLADSFSNIAYVNALPVRIVHCISESGFSSSKIWRVAAQVYGIILGFFNPISRNTILVANSFFMQDILKRYLGKDSIVIHPPVNIGIFSVDNENYNRKNQVVAISRFRTGKNLNIIPIIAKLAEKTQFKIVGVADSNSAQSIEKLKKAIEASEVENRVQILINLNFGELVALLKNSKVFLGTQLMESFGLAVVEAMASGCVPVVPKNGGPWLDILDKKQGAYGYSYHNAFEAAEKILLLINDESFFRSISARSKARSNSYGDNFFDGNLLLLIKVLQK